MSTYYVDSLAGRVGQDGRSPETAVSSWREVTVQPGDSLLFKRGSFFRDVLELPAGTKDAPLYVGAYGEGEKPVFCGSVQIACPEKWIEIRENVWEYQGTLPSEPCNLIFEDGTCGNLAWEEDELTAPDWWHYTMIGGEGCYDWQDGAKLYLYSPENPAQRHPSIEAAVYGSRHMVSCPACAVFEDLAFINSGVHGYGEANAHDVAFRRCEFRYIGGKVWSRPLKIRFGNGVEFWDHSENMSVEDCLFDQIYDSCVTHQGPGEEAGLAVNILYRGNTFRNYGMGAYEARDKVGLNVVFENNVCIGAGEGFSLQGETPPRRSEIWPQPMGHHLFIWRMPAATENGSIIVRNNVFGSVPYGAAVYSIISPEAEAQFTFEGNRYEKEQGLIVRWNGVNCQAEDNTNPLK